jgi:hypothetical protein
MGGEATSQYAEVMMTIVEIEGNTMQTVDQTTIKATTAIIEVQSTTHGGRGSKPEAGCRKRCSRSRSRSRSRSGDDVGWRWGSNGASEKEARKEKCKGG